MTRALIGLNDIFFGSGMTAAPRSGTDVMTKLAARLKQAKRLRHETTRFLSLETTWLPIGNAKSFQIGGDALFGLFRL